jgi:hypothetical protein
MKKWWLVVLSAMLVIAMVFAGCSSASTQDSDTGYASAEAGAPAYDGEKAVENAEEPDYAAEESVAEEESGGAGETVDSESAMLEPVEERKIIYYGNIEAQTENFDEDYNSILAKLNEYGGYVESSSVSGTKPEEWQDTGRSAQMTLRIPSDKFDEFMVFMGEMGETISSSVSGKDISLEYFDIETKLKTLRTREDRLEALLEKAATLEDIISLEQALADVSYEIQSLEMSLRDYDSLIDYSSVTIYLQEVQVITEVTPSSPKTLGERISSGFYSVLNVLADIGEGLLVFLIAGSPVLVPLGAIIFLIVFFTKRSKKKRAKEAAENASAGRAAGAYYDPRTGFPYNNGMTPNASPKEGQKNEEANKDKTNDQ